jgi:uncharacterized membrane protein YtjA (UPF0391 family)
MAGWVSLNAAAALIAALLGFGGASGVAAGLAQVSFFVCLVGLMVSLVLASVRGATD